MLMSRLNMAKRHPIRLGFEAALVCALIGVLVYRFASSEQEPEPQGEPATQESRLAAFAKKRAVAAREDARRQGDLASEFTEDDLLLSATDFEDPEPTADGVLLLQVLDAAGKEVAGPYLLVCPEAGYTNTVSAASLRFDLSPGFYRFGAVQEVGAVVFQAPDRMIQVVSGKAVALTLRMTAETQKEAGIGVSLRKTGDWFEVVLVEPGWGAQRMGIEAAG